MTIEFADPQACVDAIIAHVGSDVRIATPLAGGKPNHLLNAFYRRAEANPDMQLTIMTALTLEKPKGRSELERRYLEPFVARAFGNYPDLDYELDRVAGRLPDNVRVIEFYLAPGKYIGNGPVQRDYVSSNYTHAARDILDRGVNVLAQQVAKGEVDGQPRLSLSCNPDLTIDLMAGMRREAERGKGVALVAQTNGELPFMYGDAVLCPEEFDFLVCNPELDFTLFGMPKMAVSEAELAIGLYCSSLVKDGGELQVGIGAVGDAIVHALALRHTRNDRYRDIVRALGVEGRFMAEVEHLGELGSFDQGLFAASEMLVDGFLHLYRCGVIKRRVYDDVYLQRLLNQGSIGEEVTQATFEALTDVGAISTKLTPTDIDYLVHFGVFRSGVSWAAGELIDPQGRRYPSDLGDPETARRALDGCLGDRLKHAAVMHGGFFLGNQAFYEALRTLPDEERQLIRMRSITRINQLYGHEEIDRLHRRDARFINTCMMITLTGAAISDGLEDGTVISGVGGQYNFIDMAQALPDGHSVLNMRATRTVRGKAVSNIVWSHGHITIPRHLRDVYVTEYGIAYVRGKTDQEIIVALLNVTDSRFQGALLAQAKTAGKLEPGYEILPEFRSNFPEALSAKLRPFREAGLLPAFPLGCDFTEEELVLGRALRSLSTKIKSPRGVLSALGAAIVHGGATDAMQPLLARMGLEAPRSFRERLYRRLLAGELAAGQI